MVKHFTEISLLQETLAAVLPNISQKGPCHQTHWSQSSNPINLAKHTTNYPFHQTQWLQFSSPVDLVKTYNKIPLPPETLASFCKILRHWPNNIKLCPYHQTHWPQPSNPVDQTYYKMPLSPDTLASIFKSRRPC